MFSSDTRHNRAHTCRHFPNVAKLTSSVSVSVAPTHPSVLGHVTDSHTWGRSIWLATRPPQSPTRIPCHRCSPPPVVPTDREQEMWRRPADVRKKNNLFWRYTHTHARTNHCRWQDHFPKFVIKRFFVAKCCHFVFQRRQLWSRQSRGNRGDRIHGDTQ